MKKQYLEYIKRAISNGTKLLSFDCPRCHMNIDTLAAPAGDLWDSLCTCPYCGALFLKTASDKKVLVNPVAEGM